VPSDARAAYFAIRAFNVELATVHDQINGNAMAGRIRFQWWRDVLKDIVEGSGEQANQQPVATALRQHIPEKALSIHWFERSIDAR
jgi:phytoene/squalene synthetase